MNKAHELSVGSYYLTISLLVAHHGVRHCQGSVIFTNNSLVMDLKKVRFLKPVLMSNLKLLCFAEEMVIPPGEVQDEDEEETSRVDVTCADHPLSSNPDSLWQAFFKDNEVLLQIDKDVRQVSHEVITGIFFYFVL